MKKDFFNNFEKQLELKNKILDELAIIGFTNRKIPYKKLVNDLAIRYGEEKTMMLLILFGFYKKDPNDFRLKIF